MKKLIKYLLPILLILNIVCRDQSNKMGKNSMKNITIEDLNQMFSNIREDYKWKLNKPLIWGYFFTHHEPKLLEKARDILIEKGYHFVDIFMSEKSEESEPDLWWLHVEKEEIHIPESLDNLNNEFYELADKLGLDSYDGMDVGQITSKK